MAPVGRTSWRRQVDVSMEDSSDLSLIPAGGPSDATQGTPQLDAPAPSLSPNSGSSDSQTPGKPTSTVPPDPPSVSPNEDISTLSEATTTPETPILPEPSKESPASVPTPVQDDDSVPAETTSTPETGASTTQNPPADTSSEAATSVVTPTPTRTRIFILPSVSNAPALNSETKTPESPSSVAQPPAATSAPSGDDSVSNIPIPDVSTSQEAPTTTAPPTPSGDGPPGNGEGNLTSAPPEVTAAPGNPGQGNPPTPSLPADAGGPKGSPNSSSPSAVPTGSAPSDSAAPSLPGDENDSSATAVPTSTSDASEDFTSSRSSTDINNGAAGPQITALPTKAGALDNGAPAEPSFTDIPFTTNTLAVTTSSLVFTSEDRVFTSSTTLLTTQVLSTRVPVPTSGVVSNAENDDGKNVGAMVGGAIGGAIILLAVAVVAWIIFRRRRRREQELSAAFLTATPEDFIRPRTAPAYMSPGSSSGSPMVQTPSGPGSVISVGRQKPVLSLDSTAVSRFDPLDTDPFADPTPRTPRTASPSTPRTPTPPVPRTPTPTTPRANANVDFTKNLNPFADPAPTVPALFVLPATPTESSRLSAASDISRTSNGSSKKYRFAL